MDLAAADRGRAASEMSGAELQGKIHLRQIAEVEGVMA